MPAEITSTFLNIKPIDMTNVGFTRETLKGEVAVVTGGASNVGLGYSRSFAWAGAKVVIADLNEEAGKEAERVINAENAADSALFVKCDISRDSDVKNLAKRAFEKFGKVDILINNAMNMRLHGFVLDAPISELEQTFAISARGTMLAIQEFVPLMIERKHGVVTYSASQFHYCLPLIAGPMYCVGKAAATSIVMSLANEVKGTGVNVFCLAPTGVARFDPNETDPAKMPPIPDWAPKMDQTRNIPGFDSSAFPPEAAGAAMIYCILNASTLHGSGVSIMDVFEAMNYPYPCPETLMERPKSRRLNDLELTTVFLNMGPGFTAR